MATTTSDKIIAFFDLNNRSSSIVQEVGAGITCFLTMSYILLVNPQVLSNVGIHPTDIGEALILTFILNSSATYTVFSVRCD